MYSQCLFLHNTEVSSIEKEKVEEDSDYILCETNDNKYPDQALSLKVALKHYLEQEELHKDAEREKEGGGGERENTKLASYRL